MNGDDYLIDRRTIRIDPDYTKINFVIFLIFLLIAWVLSIAEWIGCNNKYIF